MSETEATGKLKQLLSETLQQPLEQCTKLAAGGNNRCYRILAADGRQYLAKHYFQDASDRRDRLGTEFTTLKVLQELGFRNVAKPVAKLPDDSIAIYEYIAGERPHPIDETDVEAALDFLLQLWRLRNTEACRSLPNASEACFSPEAIIINIESRRKRLCDAAVEEPHVAMQSFLQDEFDSVLRSVARRCRNSDGRNNISFSLDILWQQRILSPSDFGFHNALRTSCGDLFFIDFEYFGWDDPAKTCCDFLLHPGMNLPWSLRRTFLLGFLGRMHDCENLKERIELLYPLFALKWCLILLNEFLPSEGARRQFAASAKMTSASLLLTQLQKSKQMLQKAQCWHICRNLSKSPHETESFTIKI